MELGKRSFHVAVIWNSLPEHLRSTSMSKDSFGVAYLSQRAYNTYT